MSLTIEHLKSKLADLQRQLAEIDLAAARASVPKAEADFADIKEQARAQGFNDHKRYGELATEDRMSKARLQQAQSQHAVLSREISRLSGMLFADQRIAAAAQAHEATAAMVTSARAAVRAADEALTTIDGMIAAEQQAFDVARTSAASTLLATIKARGDTSTVSAPNLDKVATLELAKNEAQQERDAAGAALKAAERRAAESAQQLSLARAGATELAHEVALSAYIDALVEHQVAHAVAYRQPFYMPNILDAAGPRVERRMASLGL